MDNPLNAADWVKLAHLTAQLAAAASADERLDVFITAVEADFDPALVVGLRWLRDAVREGDACMDGRVAELASLGFWQEAMLSLPLFGGIDRDYVRTLFLGAAYFAGYRDGQAGWTEPPDEEG